MKYKMNRIAVFPAALSVAVMLCFGVWLVRYYAQTHSKNADEARSVSQSSRLKIDAASYLRGSIFDSCGKTLVYSDWEDVPVQEETKEEPAKEEKKGKGKEISGFGGFLRWALIHLSGETEESYPIAGDQSAAGDEEAAGAEQSQPEGEESQTEEEDSPWKGDSLWGALGAYAKGVPTPEEQAESEAEAAQTQKSGSKTRRVQKRYVTEEYNRTLSCILGNWSQDAFDNQKQWLNDYLVNGCFSRECKKAQRGDDVTLTLDADLCEKMRQVLVERGVVKGCSAVMDIRTGAIIGMASLPNYDVNAANAGDRKQIRKDMAQAEVSYNQVLLPRNLGSSMKPISAIAIVRSGISQEFVEQDGIQVGNGKIPNAYGSRHDGEHLDLAMALRYSSNAYFASKLVEASGVISMEDFANSLHLDESQNIQTDFGTIRSTYQYETDYELGLNAFGQGGFTLSPIQLCMIYGAIATGDLVQPYMVSAITSPSGKVVYETNPIILEKDAVSKEESRSILNGMRYASDYYNLDNDSAAFSIAAKSGTAQMKRKKNKGVVTDVNTVMGALFPANDPQYAMVIVCADDPDNHHAGANHAPAIRKIADYTMKRRGGKAK